MPRPPLLALALSLLLPTAALAEPPIPRASRTLVLPLNRLHASDAPVQEVFVSSGTSTIISTPWEIRARATGIGGRGERPFELLVGKARLVVTPTRPLVPGERFPLLVRLADDTLVPLILVAAPAGRPVDGEVVISFDFDEAAQLRVQLAALQQQAQSLQARLRQALQEQDADDFALAGLLARGREDLTAFRPLRRRELREEGAGLTSFAPMATERHAPRKVAAVLTLTNRWTEPIQISAGDLYSATTLGRVPCAMRTISAPIPPGSKARLSVVLDLESFGPDGKDALALELQVRRGGSPTTIPVELVAADFAPPGPATWWPF